MTVSHARLSSVVARLPLPLRTTCHRKVTAGLVAGLTAGLMVSGGAALAADPVKLFPGQVKPVQQGVTTTDPAAPKPVPALGQVEQVNQINLAPTSPEGALKVMQVPGPSAPRALVSPKQPEATGKPRRIMTLTVKAPKPAAAPQEATPTTTQTPSQVEDKEIPAGTVVVGVLTEIDPSSVGLLDSSSGGFGPGMWQGSNRQRIEALLPRLPMGSLSPTMQSLARRLLLSSAAVPEGKAIAPSLLGLRVERLAAGGLTNETNQLLRLVPARMSDPAFTRAEMEGLLLSGDRASFCVRIESLVADDPNPYWLKGLAFCKALEGEVEAVDLAVSILRDQGVTGDEAFFILAQALTGDEEAVVQSLIDPTPLQLAMLRAAQQPLPADAVPGASPGILRAQATMANADIEIRLAAAEKAETAGALDTGLLSQIYAGIQFSEDELQNWKTHAETIRGARMNALMFQAATVETDIKSRVVTLSAAWLRARDEGGFGTMARITYDLTRVIEPSDDLVWAAVDIARTLLMAGDVKSARRWFDYVRELALLPPSPEPEPVMPAVTPPVVATEVAPGLPKLAPTETATPVVAPPVVPAPRRPVELAAKAVLDLWPLMQLADTAGELGWNPQAVDAWLPVQRDLLGENVAVERAAMLFVLLDALGYKLPEPAWDDLLQGSLTVTAYVPSPALVRSLETAAEEGRLGETVLLGLLALGDVGPAGAASSTLQSVIQAFNAVGLQAEARTMALEAVLGRGF